MSRRKWMMPVCLAVLGTVLSALGPPASRGADPILDSQVPHYFGPYPNWALSPLPKVDAAGGVTGGIRKFMDTLPVLYNPAGQTPPVENTLGQYLPVAVPDTTFTRNLGLPDADYYEIALVQYRQKMHTDLPPTLLRGYVQLSTTASPGQHVPLMNVLLDGREVPALDANGNQLYGVTKPSYLGPVIVAQRDRPVRVRFVNLLPTGSDGDLFLPVDSTMMGAGMGPMSMQDPLDLGLVTDQVRNPICTRYPKGPGCFKDNRATLHLHGGVTPWISDGTPHQWTTPAGESTNWPQGVSVRNVPDMTQYGPRDGSITFYYSNQQSARLMFYHDHSWGITRLNVYAGEAAGYLITDAVEQSLKGSVIPGDADTIPLIIQDRTFVPDDLQLYGDLVTDPQNPVYGEDPTWDKTRWGGMGSLWYHHVYMPAQNPNDISGMSAYGRWMYGPWFWPPASPKYGVIPNPRYNMDPATNYATSKPCFVSDPATWQFKVDPFCEPPVIPGTPNLSVGMEQFNDTPVVNGTAYPTVTIDPKPYRLRILNAANDRFFNLQLYVADATSASTALNASGEVIGGTEVALKRPDLAAAQLDPTVFPTPDTNLSPPGPNWIQIGSEGGFLPYPAVIQPQPITWITDPTRFDFGNVDQHSLLLAPAERADVVVDFTGFANTTLILYNDAPAAFPARVASYDYYTGAPDLSPVGAPGVLAGYGPNTRTVMQIKVRGTSTTPAQSFDLVKLQDAFAHHLDPTGKPAGVFESGQHPIIVGQAGIDPADDTYKGSYNLAYGTKFVTKSWCNATLPPAAPPINSCDGLARIFDQGGSLFGFNTLTSASGLPPYTASAGKLQVRMEPKALHDEMNAVAFDEFGRMTANIGLEAVPAAPGVQNVILYPYVNPPTEFIDGTNLPKGDLNVTAIASQDGTQIWKITHNGVDTHPIHFHLYDVQLLNRVTWDNIIIPPDLNELGWKETVRVSPLEDTIVALRPIVPTVPFEVPNSIRLLSPMMLPGATAGFENTDIAGNPTDAIVNQLVNFGWEYVFHCHILSHEEMDMMRPVSLVLPPLAPSNLGYNVTGNGSNRRVALTWNDNSITETSFLVQKTLDSINWTTVGTIQSPLGLVNGTGQRTFTDPASYNAAVPVRYQVVAQNAAGYGGEFPSFTARSTPATLLIGSGAAAPNALTAALQTGPQVSLSFTDNATNEVGFLIERATNGGAFTRIAIAPAHGGTGTTTYVDTTVAAVAGSSTTYAYRVAALNAAGPSAYAFSGNVVVPPLPPAPATLSAVNGPNGNGNNRSVTLTWPSTTTNVTGFTIQRATNSAFTSGLNTQNVAAGTTTVNQTGLSRNTQYWYRIRSNDGPFVFSAWTNATPSPIRTNR